MSAEQSDSNDAEAHHADLIKLGLFDYIPTLISIEGKSVLKARMNKPERKAARHELELDRTDEIRAIRL